MTSLRKKDRKERIRFLENEVGVSLEAIDRALVDDQSAVKIENLIGAVSVPLGVAGPLTIKGNPFGEKKQFIPLATTEGGLIASVNRGCKIISLSGGAVVDIYRPGATRGPVFYTKGIKKGKKLLFWLKNNYQRLKEKAEETSSHLRLIKLEPKPLGCYLFIRFYFDTEEAMGMNMVSLATEAVTQLIEKELGIASIALSGNFCIDKKPAWLNFIKSRGFEVWAEAVLKKNLIRRILKTKPEKIFEVWLAKCMIGSAISGSLGFNSHFANIVAAVFAATGQDLAHVVEGSLGITIVKMLPQGDLYFSVYLPSLMVGIVGGGTRYKTQQEGLKIINVGSSEELAQVLAGAVLAGEISLLSALAQGKLAESHKRLGR